MNALLERVAAGEALVADGAMGTLLIERGLPAGAPPESINRSRPEVLSEIARLYRDAGADIVHTNTFGGTSLRLALHGLEDAAEEINRRAVVAAREGLAAARETSASAQRPAAPREDGAGASAASATVYVSGSCGPTGRLLTPYGDTPPDAVLASFREQMRALIAAGVDLLTIETMTDLQEAVLAVRAAREISGEIPIIATMTFERTPRGFFTIMGNPPGEAAAALAAAGADLIGSNCGQGSDDMLALARELRACANRPLVIQPNAGLPEIRDGRAVYPETPKFMAERAREMLAIGVAVIGGCCGTTPEHIRALREVAGAGRGPARAG